MWKAEGVKPMDPRLLKYAKTARGYIIFITVFGFFSAVFIIAQDWLISKAATPVIMEHQPLSFILPTLGVLVWSCWVGACPC